jgi:hypothetical protein
MTTAPVSAVPAVAMPAPVTAVPMPMPVMSPAHLFRLEAVHLIGSDVSMTDVPFGQRQSALRERMRRKRCGLRTRSQGYCTRNKSKAEFQKVSAFHDISLLVMTSDAREILIAPR